LFGLFGSKGASGPSLLIIILIVATVIHNITINKYLKPLEQNLPVDLLSTHDEERPLLVDNDDVDGPDHEEQTRESQVHRFGSGNLPSILLDPLAKFVEPHIFASQEALRPWLQDSSAGENDMPSYTDDDITKAYLNPAMTSKTPVVWLARDEHDVSKHEVEENEAVGIPSTDEGAFLDHDNAVIFDKEDWTQIPIFRRPKLY